MNTTPMDAFLLACWPCDDVLLNQLEVDPALLVLADKPMLQRALERLVELGCREVLVVLGEVSAPYRALLGDGRRWGCRIAYCSADDGALPLRVLKRYLPPPGRRVLVAVSDSVVLSELASARSEALFWVDSDVLCWTGWARLDGNQIERLLLRADSRATLEMNLLCASDVPRQRERHPLISSEARLVLDSLPRLLGARGAARGIARLPQRPGIWIGNGSRVHPTAQLIAPVCIGSHAHIGPDAVIGPHALIGEGCVLDRACRVSGALVAAHTYVGAGVELAGAVVFGPRYAHVRLGQVLYVDEHALLGMLGAHHRPGFGQRLLARLLWTASWPLARLLAARGHVAAPPAAIGIAQWNVRHARIDAARLNLVPARAGIYSGAAHAWQTHFLHTLHPGLLDVAGGRAVLIGIAPRSVSAASKLPDYWQRLYRNGKVGLFNETLLLGCEGGPAAMRHAGDVLASEARSKRATLVLLLRYGGRLGQELWAQAWPGRPGAVARRESDALGHST
jgi:hypothetical protein